MASPPAKRTRGRATHRDGIAVDTRDALELFGALIDAIPDGIVVVDETGTIVLINDQTERLFGYRRRELLGQPVDVLVPERFRSARRPRGGLFPGGESAPDGSGMELFAARRDGQEFPVEISLSPLNTRMGALVVCAIRDVTLRREAQRVAERAAMADVREANAHLVTQTVRAQVVAEEAEQESHLKDEFLATVSHELRTPLIAILGWARMLGSKRLSPERAEHATAAIERSATALAHMVDDLLDVARIVKGTLRLSPQSVDLHAVVEAALEDVRHLAAAKNIRLAFAPRAGHRAVAGDPERLQQVMWNLLVNAIKFTPEDGRVGVIVESSTDHVEIRVVDTGHGIPADLLPHVFERFRQADTATTQRHTGLGLGLNIVRQLVELHGGTVHAESPGAEQGATFTVRLPVSADDPVAGAEPLSPPRLGSMTVAGASLDLPTLDGLRILIVDDDADVRLFTSVVLTEAGGTTGAVASVREALQLIERERPDVIVSGIDLQGEDGYALIRQIRQLEAVHGGFLPAVALTRHARVDDRGRAFAAGFQMHAPKPVEPATLIAAIAALTGRLDRTDVRAGPCARAF